MTDVATIRDLYETDRLSMKAVGKIVGHDPKTIRRRLQAMGVRIRSIWEQRKIDEAAGRVVTHSEQIKQRYAEGCYANAMTPERRRRISEQAKLRIGAANPFFGRTHSKETRRRLSKSAKSRTGERNPFFGREHSIETRLKISAARGGDGVEFIPKRGYPKEWTHELREMIRERDGFACLVCGAKQNGRKHSVHHVDYDRTNNVPENLATTCVRCHCKTTKRRAESVAFFATIGLGLERRLPSGS